jgi:hypothetical protein
MWFKANNVSDVLPGVRWSVSAEQRGDTSETQYQSPRTALVTGASSGIGCEIARILAENNYNLVLVARDRERLLAVTAELESRHGITATPICKDLSLADSPAELLAETRQRSMSVDVLVNNAGFALGENFASADLSQTVALLNVNVVALTQLTRLFLPGMLSRQRGRILNVGSIAGFYPGPLTACYNASKAFVSSFSLALSNELKGTGVTATCLCPGPTKTRFAQRANLLGARAFSENVMDAAMVARIGYDAMMAGERMVIAGVRNKLRMLPIPLVPAGILAHFSRKYHEVSQG